MTLDAEDKAWIRSTLEELVRGTTIEPVVFPRLTLRQFACAVEKHPDTIAQMIRLGDIPAQFVTGERPKRIAPAALRQFNVTPQDAKARLEARNLLPPLPPSPASAIDTASRPPRS